MTSDENKHRGVLYVVATPIGNMEDITLRAIRILSEVDLVAAEDTRHTARLLSYHKISAKLISCHEYNERDKADMLIGKMISGMSLALVSDAGTPSVSDPGYVIVKKAIENSISVVPIPGVSAAITALSVSGLPTDSFVFVGFAPKQSGKRRRFLESLIREERTVIFYESPQRIIDLMEEIAEILGNRYAVLAREITKSYEEFLRGSVSEILDVLKHRTSVKGECTLMLKGCEKAAQTDSSDLSGEIAYALMSGKSVSEISKILASQYGISRKKVYEQALNIREKEGIGDLTATIQHLR